MMKHSSSIEGVRDGSVLEAEETDLLLPLILRQSANVASPGARPVIVVGELIGLKDSGQTPLVIYPGQEGSAAVPARSIVDLEGRQIGRHVVLLFEPVGNAAPIVMGVLREEHAWRTGDEPRQVEVQADGDRVTVSARKQLVLRCGKASITLTEEGKVLTKGTYLSSRSSGVHRIKGGSVQIN